MYSLLSRTGHTLTLDDDNGTEIELQFKPVDGMDPLIHQSGFQVVVAYLVHDDDCENPLDNSDGYGRVVGRGKYQTRNHSEVDMFEALGLDRHGDPDYEKVADDVNAAWVAYLERQDSDFWSAVIDELGYPPPVSEDECNAAGEYINALRDELVTTDIFTETRPYYALCDANSYLTEHDFSSHQASNAAALFHFDVEKVQHDLWIAARDRGDIGDKDAVVLDVYDHSGLHWSISGGGMQCRWDTSSGAGVWLPDDVARDEIDRRDWVYASFLIRKPPAQLRGTGKDYQLLQLVWKDDEHHELVSVDFSDNWDTVFKRAEQLAGPLNPTDVQRAWGRRQAARELAQQALDEYNAWLGGDVYGCVIETFTNISSADEPEWVQSYQDACWGYVGSDWAMQALREEFYDGAVADLQAASL
jgi:hypothetical protein